MNFIHDDQAQSLYDSFNHYIFSSDRKLFGKIASKLEFCDLTKNVPGDVVELGVFKGSGLFGWAKALEVVGNKHKKIIGFDFFSMEEVVESVKTIDKNTMRDLFAHRGFDPKNYEDLLMFMLDEAKIHNCDLVKGDVCRTIPDYLEKNPGFRASIINFDLDLEEPTGIALDYLWDRLVPGGYLIFDEYAFNEWTESNAVDKFCHKRGLKPISTRYYAPSAYIQK